VFPCEARGAYGSEVHPTVRALDRLVIMAAGIAKFFDEAGEVTGRACKVRVLLLRIQHALIIGRFCCIHHRSLDRLLNRKLVLAPVLLVEFAPIAGDVAAEEAPRLLAGAGQSIQSAGRGHNLATIP
jgi:hypothetical protein